MARFLGSAKTTLLRHLLADPGLADTAVIINDHDETGLEPLLVSEVAEHVALLLGLSVVHGRAATSIAHLPGGSASQTRA